MLTAHIEIPKGATRRTYLSRDKVGYVDLGPIKDAIPVNDGVMPIHYGFIVDTVNRDEESEWLEEVDVLVYSNQKFKQGDLIPIEPFALMRREDRDDKVIARVASESMPQKWEDIPEKDRELLVNYFGYKSKVIAVGGADSALSLIEKSMNQTEKI